MSLQNLPQHKRKLVQEERLPLVAPEDLLFILGSLWMIGLKLLPASARPGATGRLCKLLATVWHKANLRDARRVRGHLEFLFPGRWSKTEIESHVRAQLTLTVWNALVLALLPSLSAEQVAQMVSVEGLQHLDALQAQRKPALLLGCHAGPYAYPVAAILQSRGYPVHEIGHGRRPRQGSSRLYRKIYWPRVTAVCKHLSVVDPLDGPQRQLLDLLQKKEILYFLPDQYFILQPGESRSQHLVQVDLFGHTANLESGGLRLGKRMGAEALMVLPFQEDNRYRVLIEPLLLPTIGTSPADLAQDLRIFLERLEERIYAQPFLWRDLRRSDLLERLGVTEGPAVP